MENIYVEWYSKYVPNWDLMLVWKDSSLHVKQNFGNIENIHSDYMYSCTLFCMSMFSIFNKLLGIFIIGNIIIGDNMILL